MRIVQLSDACEINMGQAPKGDTYNTDNIGLPLIAGASDFGELTPTPSRFTTAPWKKSRKGDIIICIRATIGDLNWANKEYCLGRGVAGIRPKEGVADAHYLWQVLAANSSNLKAKGRGATFKQVSRQDIAELKIPLPPLDEQKRIAAILDQADALRRLRQSAIDHLNTLAQSIFYEMFGDPREKNHKFEKKNFGSFAEILLGKMLDKGKFKGEKTHKYLRNANVQWFKFELDNVFEMEFSPKDYDRFLVKKGDILICEGGEPGRCAIWDQDETIFYQKALHRVRLDPETACASYIVYWFYLASKFNLLAGSMSTATIAHLTNEKIKQLSIPIPPIDLQEKFRKTIEELNNQLAIQAKSLLKLEEVFSSLQQRAFRGEL